MTRSPLFIGEAYAKLDDLEKAEYWYKEALSAKEDHIPAHLTMAKLANRRGKAHEAEAWFSKAMKIHPTEGSIYQHYGKLICVSKFGAVFFPFIDRVK